MRSSKKRLIGLLVIIQVIFTYGFLAIAREYPSKPVALIIPYPAGGSTDLTGRALAHAAKKYLGQPIICENKCGGGGTVGPSLVVTKPPDGYTIGISQRGCHHRLAHGETEFQPPR